MLLVESYDSNFGQRCLMSARRVMEIPPTVPFYIYTANMSAKAVSLPKHMIVISASNVLPHVVHARSVVPDTVDELRFGSMTEKNGGWVETNNVIPSTQLESPISLQKRNTDTLAHISQHSTDCQDESDNQKWPIKLQMMETPTGHSKYRYWTVTIRIMASA